MPLKIWIDMDDFTDPGTFNWTYDETKNLFMEVARLWYRQSGAKFNFDFVSSPGSHTMAINAADLGLTVRAQVVHPGGTPGCYIWGTKCCPIEMTLNNNPRFSSDTPTISAATSSPSWGDAVIHEFGHAIGLDHPTSGTDTVMYEHNNRISLTWEDIRTVRENYGMRSQQLKHWMYPWSGSWADLGYIPGANTNLAPSIAAVPNSSNICVAYATDEYWTRLITKKGLGSSWITKYPGSYTNAGVNLAYGGGKYLLVFVNEINTIYGEADHYLYYQTSNDCENWSSPSKLPVEPCMGLHPRSAMRPAIAWSNSLGEFIVVGSTWFSGGAWCNKLHIYYYNPTTGTWRFPYSESNCHLKDGQGDFIRAVGGTSLTCSSTSTTCLLTWRDDSGSNEGNIRAANIQHYWDLIKGKYYPYLSNFLDYSYGSSHGIGDGTYFPSDPHSMKSNFFRIYEFNTDIGYLYFVKTNGINEISQYIGYHLWEAVGSCYSAWWNTIFAVGSDASYDYP